MITFALPLPVPLISSIPASVRFSKPEASVQNPRYVLPYTRFPSVRLQPLGHLSAGVPILARQQPVDLVQQLAIGQRLRDVEVRAGGDTLRTVGLAAFRRQHDHLDAAELGACTQSAADFVSAAPGIITSSSTRSGRWRADQRKRVLAVACDRPGSRASSRNSSAVTIFGSSSAMRILHVATG